MEHKPGIKIGLAEYLSMFAKPVSQYDITFTAKINSINKTLGLRKLHLSGGSEIKQQNAFSKHVSTNRNVANYVQKLPLLRIAQTIGIKHVTYANGQAK